MITRTDSSTGLDRGTQMGVHSRTKDVYVYPSFTVTHTHVRSKIERINSLSFLESEI